MFAGKDPQERQDPVEGKVLALVPGNLFLTSTMPLVQYTSDGHIE